MTKKGFILTVITWVMITLINYYYINFFFLAFIWIGMVLTLLICTIIQIIRTIRERKKLTKLRIAQLLTFTLLFILTFDRHTIHLIIEKFDWSILENRRNEIVKQVKDKELNPNVSWNAWVCKLPFEFPVVSNGGNDIGIYRNKENNGTTVTFWIFRNFFEYPSTHFVYTDDPEKMKELDKKAADKPDNNWKIKENWYRIYGD